MADSYSQKIPTNVISPYPLPLLCQTWLVMQLFLLDSTPRVSTPSYRSGKYLGYRDLTGSTSNYLNWPY